MAAFHNNGVKDIRESILVEGKTFLVVWDRSFSHGEVVSITERRGGQRFLGCFSINGCKWLGKLLCQASLGSTSVGSAFRLVEDNGSVTGTIRSNRRGNYLQVVTHSRSRPRAFPTLCFPEGNKGDGWGLLGSKLRSMFEGRADTHPSGVAGPVRRFDLGSSISFAQVCQERDSGREYGTMSNNLDLFLTGDSSTSENWGLMITCKATGSNPDWKWCEEKVKGVFGYSSFLIMKKNKALFSLKTQEEVEKIVGMPPLESWNGAFHFKKWSSEDGVLSNVSVEGFASKIQIGIHGLPYHLRTGAALKRMAHMWGYSNVTNVKEGINELDLCGFTIEHGNVASIPRLIYVREGSRRFPVLIEISFPPVIGEEKGSTISEFVSGDPHRVGPSDSTAVDQRHVHSTGYSSNSSLYQPPGFERNGTHLTPQVPFPSNHGPGLSLVNSFAPLNSGGAQVQQGEAFVDEAGGPVQIGGPGQDQGMGEEPLRPLVQQARPRQRRSRSARRGLNTQRIPLGFGPRTQLLRYEIARLGNRRGRSRVRFGEKDNAEAHFGVLGLSPVLVNIPSSSSSEVERVSDSQPLPTPGGILANRKEDLIREVAISLRRNSQEGDLRNLINWVVIPLAEDLGFTSSLGREGQERLFSELATQDNADSARPVNDEGERGDHSEGGAAKEPRVQIVNDVA
ncbi:hypothetical protein FRX31_013824 [Thalictrum thalictroides]|uniref:DUF4283 domain-containing protein n=1 Tax=Thalictrum thalictroides TaxID=46969 RepID=A0A7J6WI55_THATH|nr:hypothetical protein FRX31_013824 [Thalictrum thalictroides]